MAQRPDDPRSSRPARGPAGGPSRGPSRGPSWERPTLRVFPTTLWEYPSQHYTSTTGRLVGPAAKMQGDKAYVGATPSWVIWQLLTRYTREGDAILDPMAGSGTTHDVCIDLNRRPVVFDLVPSRPEIAQADARRLPIPPASIDFAFIDPPYSTHVDYSDHPDCIGKLDAAGEDQGHAYYDAMDLVIAQLHRALKPGRYMGLYVSDSFRKRPGKPGGVFMPIGFELFARLRQRFEPVDIIAVVRHNQKLTRGNWRKAAEDGNYFLRGFNYCFIMRKSKDNAPKRTSRADDVA